MSNGEDRRALGVLFVRRLRLVKRPFIISLSEPRVSVMSFSYALILAHFAGVPCW